MIRYHPIIQLLIPTFCLCLVACGVAPPGEVLHHTIQDATRRTSHTVFVMGLWPEAHCELHVVDAPDEAGTVAIDVDPLPSFLPDLDVITYDADRMRSGWTIFNLNNRRDAINAQVGMYDPEGRLRWYHSRAVDKP